MSDSLDARLRENERVTALQGQTLKILVEDTKKHADKETLDKLDDLTRNQIVPDVAVLKSKADGNTAAGSLGGLTGFFREAKDGKPLNLAIIFLGLPFTLFMLAFLVAAALGNAGGFIGGLSELIHGPVPEPVTITVEDGASLQAPSVDAEALDVEAGEVNVVEDPRPPDE